MSTPKNKPSNHQSEMYSLSRQIEKLVARSMSGQASADERDSIRYLSRQRAALLSQPPRKKKEIA
jgi:hypothetical protein